LVIASQGLKNLKSIIRIIMRLFSTTVLLFALLFLSVSENVSAFFSNVEISAVSPGISDTSRLVERLSAAYRDVGVKTSEVEKELPSLKEAIDRLGYYRGVVQYASIIRAIHAMAERHDKIVQAIEQLLDEYKGKLTLTETVQIRMFIANAYANSAELVKAEALYTELLPLAEKDERLLAQLSNGRANVYESKGEYKIQLKDYLYAEKIYSKNGERENNAVVLNNIGLVNYSLKNYPAAVTYYLKGIRIAEQDSLYNPLNNLYPNLGVAYEKMDSLETALHWHKKGLEIAIRTGKKMGIAISLLNTGNVFAKMGNHTAALENFNRSMAVCKELGIDYGVGLNNISLGKSFGATGNYGAAVSALSKATEYFESTGMPRELMEAYEAFAEVYEKLGADDDALRYTKKFHALKDSLFQSDRIRETTELQIAYETEKKDAEIAIQAEQIKRQETENLILYLSVSSLLLLTLGAFAFYRHRERNLRALYRSSQELTNKQFVIPEEDVPAGEIPAPAPQETDSIPFENETFRDTFGRILTLMEKEKLYLSPDLTLTQLAERAHTNEKYVSAAIKKGADMNFNGFINSYRVAEAKKLLSDRSLGLSIDQMYTKCGFNSRTTFYSAFQKSTGMTPIQFKKLAAETVRDDET